MLNFNISFIERTFSIIFRLFVFGTIKNRSLVAFVGILFILAKSAVRMLWHGSYQRGFMLNFILAKRFAINSFSHSNQSRQKTQQEEVRDRQSLYKRS